jgi:hypothetical protein
VISLPPVPLPPLLLLPPPGGIQRGLPAPLLAERGGPAGYPLAEAAGETEVPVVPEVPTVLLLLTGALLIWLARHWRRR